jgi:hypothetical protein
MKLHAKEHTERKHLPNGDDMGVLGKDHERSGKEEADEEGKRHSFCMSL